MASEARRKLGVRRLHPTTLLFTVGRTLKNLLIPAIVALFAESGSFWQLLFFVSFALGTVHAVIRYLTLTWELRDEELVVKEGVLFRSERHVPYAHIQNVNLVQNPFHRFFRVAEVLIETASGAEPEAELRVLALRDVERIREHLSAQPETREALPAEPVGHVLVRVPVTHLILLGLVVNRGVAVIGVGFGLLYELGALETVLQAAGIEQRLDDLGQAGFVDAVIGILVLLTTVVGVFVSLSVAWSVLRFYGFTLRAVGDDLRLSCGILTRISASLPRHRIQTLTVVETWLHRMLDIASIAVQTAGGSGKEDTGTVLRRRFVPVLAAEDVPETVQSVIPQVAIDDLDWRPISKTAARRMRRRALIVLGILTAPVVWFTPYALIGAGLVALLAWGHAGALARRARFARTPWGLVWQHGVVTRKTTLLPNDKMQSIRLTESPFDRRNGHAAITVDAAGGGPTGSTVHIRYLDADLAEALRQDLTRAAADTTYTVRRNPRGTKTEAEEVIADS